MADLLENQVSFGYYDEIKDPKYIDTISQHINLLKKKYGDISYLNISIITTGIPFVWCNLLSEAGCKVNVYGQHPLLLENKDFIQLLPNVKVIDKNIFIDDLTGDLKHSKVVIFPDYEYYIPLQFVPYDIIDKDIFVVNYFKDDIKSMEIKQPNIVDNLENFKETIKNKNDKDSKEISYKDKPYYYFFGNYDVEYEVVKFITCKWGYKYGPEYVNRLYNRICKTYSGKFKFYCVTEYPEGLNENINVVSFDDLGYTESKCFTVQKLFCWKKDAFKFKGPYVLFDLDVVILKDLKPYFDEYGFNEGRMIKNYWDEIEGAQHLAFFGSCWINTSFVTWNGDQLDHVYQFFQNNREIIEWKYQDLDFFLFNTIPKQIQYHPEKTVYAYSFGAHHPDDMEKYKFRDDYYLAIFNTSHGDGIELHEADGWVKELWA